MGLTITDFSPSCISNLSAENMQFAVTIRSHKARGRLLHIRGPELPEEYSLLTASDLPQNTVEILGSRVPILVERETRYVGEPVALLIGPDAKTARDLASTIQVTFEDINPRFNREDIENRKVVIETNRKNGRIQNAFSKAEHIIEGVYRTGLQEHSYLEPIGALALPFSDGTLHVYTPCTDIFLTRRIICDSLDKKPETVTVEGCFPGDDLDGKLWYPALVAAQAAAAANIIQKPVQILYSHQEDSNFSPKRAPATFRIASSLNTSGNITAIDASIDIDMGSYPVGAELILERLFHQLASRYRVPAIQIEGRVISTNTPPLGFFDGWGDAAANFAVETHFNRIAQITDIDPATFRMNALVRSGKKLGLGGLQRSAPEPTRALEAVIKASDFTRKHAAYELQRKNREKNPVAGENTRGIGIAYATHPSLFTGIQERPAASTAGVRLEIDGSATILTSMYPGSSGAEVAWRSTVCEILGLPLEKSRIAPPRTDTCPNTGPETLSRGITICSKVLESCAQVINKRRFHEPLPIEVQRPFRLPTGYSKTADPASYDPFPFSSSAAAVIEVEIEHYTLSTSITGIWIAVDGGRILQPSAAMQRIEHGIYSALGFLHLEILELHHGQLAPSYSIGYRIPRFGNYPDPKIQLLQPNKKGPALGIGELPGMCIPAAGVQAISQASGIYFDQVPITPEVMYAYHASQQQEESDQPPQEEEEEST